MVFGTAIPSLVDRRDINEKVVLHTVDSSLADNAEDLAQSPQFQHGDPGLVSPVQFVQI